MTKNTDGEFKGLSHTQAEALMMQPDPSLGHNNPPEVLKLAVEVIADISGRMADVPVVETEEDARLIKMEIDRAKACIKDLEAEQDSKVRPLRDKADQIRQTYRRPRNLLGDLLDEMLARVQLFVKAEEKRRQEIALAAAAKAAALALEARAKELEEQERLDDAAKGEVGVNVAEIVADADEAFEAYCAAERAAELAEKQTHVKIGGGFSRAIGMRKTETLSVHNYHWAMDALHNAGFFGAIEPAILQAARAYRKVHGKLPDGIKSTVEEHL